MTGEDQPTGGRPVASTASPDAGREALRGRLHGTETTIEYRDESLLRLFFADVLPQDEALGLARGAKARAPRLSSRSCARSTRGPARIRRSSTSCCAGGSTSTSGERAGARSRRSAFAGAVVDELPEPSFRRILLSGLPRFVRDGFVPVGAFYLGWRLAGLGTGTAASTAVSAALWLGRPAPRPRQRAAAALARPSCSCRRRSGSRRTARSSTSPSRCSRAPSGPSCSSARRRHAARSPARSRAPGIRFRTSSSAAPRSAASYGFESVVWGAYLLARSGLRLWMLLESGVGGFVVVSFLTGTPAALALLAWSAWYATRRLPAELERELGGEEPVVA